MSTPKTFWRNRIQRPLVFNDALLGRQACRLVQKEDSILGRVMKAKYYPKCNFFDTSLAYAGSYS